MTSVLLSRRPVLIGALLVTITLAVCGLYAQRFSDTWFFVFILGQAGMALAITRLTTEGENDPLCFPLVLMTAAALRILFLFQPPLLSDDIYRYVWDGRIVNAGFNPYLHVPADPVLEPLRDPLQYRHIDKKDYAVTIYPPVAEGIFALVTRFSASLTAMKLTMIALEGIAILATIRLLRIIQKPVGLLSLYLLHPAPIWEIADNGHVDAAVMAFLLGGFAWGTTQKKRYGAATAMTLGALVKPTAALALPALWRPLDWRLPAFVIAIAVACYLPLLSAGLGVIGFLPSYFHENGLDNGEGFFVLALAQRLGFYASWMPGAYIAFAGLLITGLSLNVALSHDDSLIDALRGTALLLIVFLLLLSPTLPWYFLITALFAPVLGVWTPVAMMTGGFLLYSYNSDSVEFFPRWVFSMAFIALTLAYDSRTLLKRRSTQ